MVKTNSLWLRLAGGLAGVATFIFLASTVINLIPYSWDGFLNRYIFVVTGILGAIVGALWLPPAAYKSHGSLTRLTANELAGAVLGLILGLIAGALAAMPLRLLPQPFGYLLPTVAMIVFGWIGTAVFVKRPHDLVEWLKSVRPNGVPQLVSESLSDDDRSLDTSTILLDTSVIIDGRITDISQTGFITGSLIVPNFVLSELQLISDSPDPLRRKRGRRGLEVLTALQENCPIPLKVMDRDVSEVRDVDAKLVALARHTGSPIMTNDYNLNRVAGLQGVTVLNINDLANAVKASHLPGEELTTKVIQEGREHGQGIAYLEDGTMVVVEDGVYHMNETHTVVVTKVLQTSAGRMIFARFP